MLCDERFELVSIGVDENRPRHTNGGTLDEVFIGERNAEGTCKPESGTSNRIVHAMAVQNNRNTGQYQCACPRDLPTVRVDEIGSERSQETPPGEDSLNKTQSYGSPWSVWNRTQGVEGILHRAYAPDHPPEHLGGRVIRTCKREPKIGRGVKGRKQVTNQRFGATERQSGKIG